MAAARRVFEERGYQGASVSAIAAAAGTAHGTFYLYFANRSDAFAAVLEQVISENAGIAPTGELDDGVRAGFEQVIRSALVVNSSNRGLWRALIEAALQRNDSAAALWRQGRMRLKAHIEGLIRAGQETGELRAEVDADKASFALGSMLEWTAFGDFLLGEGNVADAIDDATAVLIDLWWASLAAPSGPSTR